MLNPKLETYKNKATGTVYDFTDADAQSKVTATVDMLKDTTGWLGGNELPNNLVSGSANHVNYSVKDNKSVEIYTDVGGSTAQTTMILVSSADNYKPKAGQKILSVSEVATAIQIVVAGYNGTTWVKNLANTATHTTFTIDYDGYDRVGVYLLVNANNEIDHKIAYPMITTPEQYALNPTYRPYHGTVDEVKADKTEVQTSISLLDDTVGWVGKNKLPNTAVSGTNRGVDFTVNTDKSITANGTNDGSDQYGSDIYIFGNNARGQRKKVIDHLENSFIFSAGIEVPSTMNVAIWFYDSSENYITTIGIPTGAKEVKVTVPNNAVYFLPYVRVYKDQTVNNVTVYPMICSKEQYALSPAYEPYHESVEGMLATKTLTSADDIDTVFTDGWYKWSGASIPAHWVGDSWAAMRVLNLNGVTLQIVYTQNEIHIRRYGGSPMSWGSFYKFTGTVVS